MSSKVQRSTARRPPNAGKGRKPGVPNRLTRSAKQAFELAFESIGGAEALARWAKANPTDFYRLYARLVPQQREHSGPGGGPFEVRAVQPYPKCETVEEFLRLVDNSQHESE